MNLVKEFRLNLGFSQKDFAFILGIKRGYLAQIESGVRNIPDYLNEKIADMRKIIAETKPDLVSTISLTSNEALKVKTSIEKERLLMVQELKLAREYLKRLRREAEEYQSQLGIVEAEMQASDKSTEFGKELKKVYSDLLHKVTITLPANTIVADLEVKNLKARIHFIEEALTKFD